MKTNRFLSNHAKSSAMIVSLVIHATLAAIAVTFVVVSVMPKEEAPFVPKKVARPKMPPKQIKVPVDTKKRKPKPRLRQRIVTDRKTLTDIQLPEISGVKGGLGNMGGTGNWNLGFDIKMDLFGGNRGGGNELVGTFFDLKQTSDGNGTGMNDGKFMEVVNGFARGWNLGRLDDYFKAPMKKYATLFMIPTMNADAAPKAYEVQNAVKPKHWVAYYTGEIAAPETGYYRFWGFADDVLLVRVRNKLVIDGCHQLHIGKMTNWTGDDPMSRKFPVPGGGGNMAVGDWFQLKEGQPTKIEILFGECPGGAFSTVLLIEQRDVEYQKSGERPILPVFKTAEVPEELRRQIRLHGMATLEGPTFGVKKDQN